MRALARFAAVPLVLVAACSSGSAEPAMDEALARDLRLASTASLALAPVGDAGLALENAPISAPAPAPTPRRAPTGERRVRSATPTVTAAPVATQASAEDAESVLETIAQPTADVSEAEAGDDEAVPLPRPTPVSIEGTGIEGSGREGGGYEGDGDRGRSGSGGGWGGVVIRGGDIDDCRIEPRRGSRPVIYRRPGSGGVGTSRWPVRSTGQTTTDNGARGGPVWSRGGRSAGSSSSGSTGGRSGGAVWQRGG